MGEVEKSLMELKARHKKTSKMNQAKKRRYLGFLGMIAIMSMYFIYGKYIYTTDDGYRSGVSMNFSQEGRMIMTYEEKMFPDTASFVQNRFDVPGTFPFLISSKKLIEQLNIYSKADYYRLLPAKMGYYPDKVIQNTWLIE